MGQAPRCFTLGGSTRAATFRVISSSRSTDLFASRVSLGTGFNQYNLLF
ncbi:hypothetical protein [Streptomyces sp. NPDC005148]